MTRLWNWGVGIATVYTIFAGATLGFVAFAMQQPVDLVSPDYYTRAKAHQDRQLAAERALALGHRFRVDADSTWRTVAITWPSDARPEYGEIRFYRPSDSQADRRELIAAGVKGVQVLSLADLAPGNWLVQCEWTSAGALFYAEQQIVVR